jgi:undecaprenyl-diphosphatase
MIVTIGTPMIAFLSRINYVLFIDLNSQAGTMPWLDALMVFCSESLIFCWFLFLLLAWGLPGSWRKRTLTAGESADLQDRRSAILWIVVACPLAYAFNLLIEQFFYEPRPFVSHHVHLLVQHAADGSFPSDHTAWSFAVVGMLAFSLLPWFAHTKRPVTPAAPSAIHTTSLILLLIGLLIACTIGIARIFVGVHYPDDIVGGAFDGLLAAFIVTFVRNWVQRPAQVIIGLAEKLRLA